MRRKLGNYFLHMYSVGDGFEKQVGRSELVLAMAVSVAKESETIIVGSTRRDGLERIC